MSEARGWRCPTGAGSGLVRTAPGLGGAGLSSGGFCAQAVPAIATATVARATGATQAARIRTFRCDLRKPDTTRSAFEMS
jgi:hypothetical protein